MIFLPATIIIIVATSSLLVQHTTAQLDPTDPTHKDFYCGWDWDEANAKCEQPCPSGLDSECDPLPNGRPRRCIAAAGCYARFTKVYWSGVFSFEFDREAHEANLAAMAEEGGGDGGDGEATAEAAEEGTALMSDEVAEAFEMAFKEYLLEAFQEERMDIPTVGILDQEYDRPCVSASLGGPSSSPTTTSLDTQVRFVGEYIPVEFTLTDDQFGEYIMKKINDNPQGFVDAIRTSVPFFNALTGVAALSEEEVANAPSASPSAPPSRGFDQEWDVRIDPRPTGSFGIVFNVRTVRGGNTVTLTGMSFVTNYDGRLAYEIYSRLGPFERFVGRTSSWELVASGETDGMGSKAYTSVLGEEDILEGTGYVGFGALHVPGDRGQRSFYVTITKRYTNDDGGPIPILFSYPISGTEGEREYDIVDSTEELEIYEGDGVLDYPWPQGSDGPYYRRPRGFIGAFEYDRYPCHPITNFTGWPCPYVPKKRVPTMNPTRKPTHFPTQHPTISPNVGVIATPLPTSNPVVVVQTEEIIEIDVPELTTVPDLVAGTNNNVTGNDATIKVESDAPPPELIVPDPLGDANNTENATMKADLKEEEKEQQSNADDTSNNEEEELINSAGGSWRVWGIRYVYGVATLVVISLITT